MPGYHDYVLGLIPLALVGVSGALAVGGLTVTTALSAGGVAASLLVAHALFVRGPGEGGESEQDAASNRRPPTAD